jgi:hypothetical protein
VRSPPLLPPPGNLTDDSGKEHDSGAEVLKHKEHWDGFHPENTRCGCAARSQRHAALCVQMQARELTHPKTVRVQAAVLPGPGGRRV